MCCKNSPISEKPTFGLASHVSISRATELQIEIRSRLAVRMMRCMSTACRYERDYRWSLHQLAINSLALRALDNSEDPQCPCLSLISLRPPQASATAHPGHETAIGRRSGGWMSPGRHEDEPIRMQDKRRSSGSRRTGVGAQVAVPRGRPTKDGQPLSGRERMKRGLVCG